jgi:hypothetical protein
MSGMAPIIALPEPRIAVKDIRTLQHMTCTPSGIGRAGYARDEIIT